MDRQVFDMLAKFRDLGALACRGDELAALRDRALISTRRRDGGQVWHLTDAAVAILETWRKVDG